MLRALPYVVPVALALFALIDLSRSLPAERVPLHPAAWVAIILLVPVLGPVVWIVVSRMRRAGAATPDAAGGRAGGGTPGPTALRRRPGRPGPVAPDDDLEFLWRLEQQLPRTGADRSEPPAAPPADDVTPSAPEPPVTDADADAEELGDGSEDRRGDDAPRG